MTTMSPPTTGHYLYCFVDTNDRLAIESLSLTGLNEERVTTIPCGPISVLTSPIINEKIRPQRKLLAAHQLILNQITKSYRLLPMAFGLIADSEEQIIQLVGRNEESILQQMDRINGCTEYSLAVEWASENVFAFFVQRYPELQEARDLIASGNATRDQQIEFGRLFEKILNQERESITNEIKSSLEAVCHETVAQPIRSEKEIVRLAMLVNRSGESNVDSAIAKAAAKFDESLSFKYSGPWPPYSFVNLSLAFNE